MGELASLTRASFDLGDKPTVQVAAGYSKRRRLDVLPLRPDTAAELRAFLGNKLPGARVFALPKYRPLSEVMRADLEAIGLDYQDAAGRFADFHSLRHTTGSLLAAAGVNPKTAQAIMRHSDINLTMARYTHVYTGQERAAVEALPNLGVKPAGEAARGRREPLTAGRRPPKPRRTRQGGLGRAMARTGGR